MKIYHGSKALIEHPIVKGSNEVNDYGPSFYLTKDLEAAKSWACKNNSVGVVNEYDISSSSFNRLNILDLTNKSKYNVLNWMAILMHFRELDSSFIKNNQLTLDWLKKYYINVDDYDVIIGFRADDSYFRFPLRFVSNDLSFDDLEEVFLSGHLGVQYAFMSERSIKMLHFKKAIDCGDEYLGHYYSIVNKASKQFDELINRPRDPRKKYILDLMREENE